MAGFQGWRQHRRYGGSLAPNPEAS